MNYQLLPDLTDEEYAALKADIAQRGVMVPVEVDEQGTILDGHHRVRICQELGIVDYPRVTRIGWTEQEKRLHVRALNLHRRHLSQAQRRELIGEQLRETPQKSDRQIAAALGVSHHTVAAARSDLESTGQIAQLGQRTGADGKARRKPAVFTRNAREAKKVARHLDLVDGLSGALLLASDIERAARGREREQVRQQNRELTGQAPSAHTADAVIRYQTIVIDPPWDWGDEGDVDQFGRGKPTYNTMPLDDIAALPVGELANANAHLYLWITNRSLPKGFALIERWGFRYVTCLTWVKPSIGMGNYYRGSTEHVLFGVRGSLPLLRHDVGTAFAAPRPGKHSQKPEEFYALVESCSPGPWLEMFARRERNGWVAWGAEA